jgi:hypothetical protein
MMQWGEERDRKEEEGGKNWRRETRRRNDRNRRGEGEWSKMSENERS